MELLTYPPPRTSKESAEEPATRGNPEYGSEERLGEELLLRAFIQWSSTTRIYEHLLHTVRLGAIGVPK